MKTITDSTLFYWLSFFITGILCSLVSFNFELLTVSIIILFSGMLLFFRFENVGLSIVFTSMFFILGFASMEQIFPEENKNLTAGQNFYVGKIKEQLTVGKIWTTNLIELDAGLDKNQKWKSTKETVLLITENDETLLQKNDLVLFQTNFNKIELLNNPGEFNAKTYWLSKGVRYQCFVTSDKIRLMKHQPLSWFDQLLVDARNYSTVVLDRWVGEKDAPLIKAILLGDKSDLGIEIKQTFTNTGAMHMLAVSGMHIGLIVLLLNSLFKYLFLYRGRVIAACLMIVLLWFYAFLTGFSASVTRAVVMFTVLIVAGLLKRGYQPINSLSIAAFFIFLWDPMSIFDIGFQLSFLAMVGIFTVYPMLENAFVFEYSLFNTIWKGTAIGLASQVFTVPVSIYYFNQFPNYFILTNFGVMLFSGVMLALAIGIIAFGKLAFLSIPIGWFLALCSSLLVGFIAFVEQIPGALSVGFTPGWLWVLLLYCVLFPIIIWMEKKKWIQILLCLFPFILWLQINRLNNLYKKEWLVFNSNYPTILLNNGHHQVCFYSAFNEKSIIHANKLVQDYQKIHPGNIEFIPFLNEKMTVSNLGTIFQIERMKGWLSIRNANQYYAIITSSFVDFEEFDSKYKIISMNQETSGKVYDLKEGAFRCDLK